MMLLGMDIRMAVVFPGTLLMAMTYVGLNDVKESYLSDNPDQNATDLAKKFCEDNKISYISTSANDEVSIKALKELTKPTRQKLFRMLLPPQKTVQSTY